MCTGSYVHASTVVDRSRARCVPNVARKPPKRIRTSRRSAPRCSTSGVAQSGRRPTQSERVHPREHALERLRRDDHRRHLQRQLESGGVSGLHGERVDSRATRSSTARARAPDAGGIRSAPICPVIMHAVRLRLQRELSSVDRGGRELRGHAQHRPPAPRTSRCTGTGTAAADPRQRRRPAASRSAAFASTPTRPASASRSPTAAARPRRSTRSTRRARAS